MGVAALGLLAVGFAQETQPVSEGTSALDIPQGALEASLGFQLGQQDFGGSCWSPAGPGGSLTDPFGRHPFELLLVSGLHLEGRIVWNQLRLGLGYQRGFPSYDFQRATHTQKVDGVSQRVAVERFAVHELRMTVGVIAPVDPVAPYVDLAGDLRELRSTLSVDGTGRAYRSSGFGLSAIGGLRGRTGEHTFVALQGEYGLTGTNFWAAQAIVGFSVL